MSRLCLIRHGETDWNLIRRIQGHIDIPLNAQGAMQAALLAEALADVRFEALYASDLQRAFQTAHAIGRGQGQPVVPLTALRERSYGDFQGLTYDEVALRFPESYAAFSRREIDAGFPGGGESLVRLFERVGNVLEQIAGRHPNGDVLVVTHGGVLDMAHRLASGLPLQQKRTYAIGNATINWMERDAQGWRIVAWDERSHLDRALDELPG